MHRITFYPIGNADCCFIETDGGKNFLFDYGNMRNKDDEEDLRVDLEAAVRSKLEEKEVDFVDVLAITHADNDHLNKFSELFYLNHAEKYQSKDRIKINELWVPSAVICSDKINDSEAKILRAEARHRLKNKQGIKVFSRPEFIDDWFEEEGLNADDYAEFFVDAGTLVPGLDIDSDGIEFFVHSPFASRQDDGTLVERNDCSIVVQCCFKSGDTITRFILGSDTAWEAWEEIVKISEYHENEERLQYDIFKLPHHCSYTTLSDDKGKDKTEPKEKVEWLFRQANTGAVIVATCDPIPSEDTDQPPHRQAAKFYKDLMNELSGEFIVTMEHPSVSKPEPIEITIESTCATLKKSSLGGLGTFISIRPSRRAG
jgi:beta-lactamase superfamily II metal-dependent hydrolase